MAIEEVSKNYAHVAPVQTAAQMHQNRAGTIPKKLSTIDMQEQSVDMRSKGIMENSDGTSIFNADFSSPIAF